MWIGIYLKGKTLKGWHLINREESLDHWVAGDGEDLKEWQNRINPELRGEVWHATTYSVSDEEIEYAKATCYDVFE